MTISFKRNRNGDLIALDETGKEVGAVCGMGDLMKYEKKSAEHTLMDLADAEKELKKRLDNNECD